LKRLTISENLTEISWLDKILDFLASPYSHKTGFYFKSRDRFTIQACGIFNILNIIIVLMFFFALFAPLMVDEKYP